MENQAESLRGHGMGAFRTRVALLGAVIVALGAGVVLAEQGDAVPADDPGELEQEATLSGPQQTAWAQEQLNNMQNLGARIQGLLDEARRDQDIIKVTCLNDKLTQVNVSVRSFEARMTQHADSARSQNVERRDHHYRLLVILAQRSRTLRLEAEGCVGETDVTFGRTNVTTEIDPSVTQDDPTEIPAVDYVFDRPPSASGYY